MMAGRRPILVAATRQHVGKTTVSLSLMNGLKKRFDKLGFIKPVGQQHIEVQDDEGNPVRVDKDVELMKDYFGLDHLNFPDMSPVIIPRSYTKRFIDGEITAEHQYEQIRRAYDNVSSVSDQVLLEGTGHVGVGSVVNTSNAQVAALLGADVVLIANGGLGSAFDELDMNRAMCKEAGATIRGVIINKVQPDKLDMVRDYLGRLLEQRWGVPLLGVVPDLPFLSKATLANYEQLLGAELIAGERYRSLHYGADNVQLVTTGLRRFLRKAQSTQAEENWKRPLYVTHCTRDDIVLGYLAHHQRNVKQQQQGDASGGRAWSGGGGPAGEGSPQEWVGAMILARGHVGSSPWMDDLTPMPYLMEMVQSYDAPVMLVDHGTLEVEKRIQGYTAKLSIRDPSRVAAAIDHYEPHIDFDLMLNG